jgi:hypothetical protein
MPYVDIRKLKAELVRQDSNLTKLARETKTPVSNRLTKDVWRA